MPKSKTAIKPKYNTDIITPLRWCDFEITLLLFGSFTEERIDPRQRQKNN